MYKSVCTYICICIGIYVSLYVCVGVCVGACARGNFPVKVWLLLQSSADIKLNVQSCLPPAADIWTCSLCQRSCVEFKPWQDFSLSFILYFCLLRIAAKYLMLSVVCVWATWCCKNFNSWGGAGGSGNISTYLTRLELLMAKKGRWVWTQLIIIQLLSFKQFKHLNCETGRASFSLFPCELHCKQTAAFALHLYQRL